MSAAVIELKEIRKLRLARSSAGRPPFLSAASGLVRVGNQCFVVADDEMHLGIFSLDPGEPGTLVRLLDGSLPLEQDARKDMKPDLEALTRVPGPALGSLLAVPSGSTAKRSLGALIPLSANGLGTPKTIDLAPLYARLAQELSDLNIEGAAVVGNSLWLLQRGNGPTGFNALVELALDRVLRDLEKGVIGADCLRKVTSCELGKYRGVPLSFTDAAPLGNEAIVFLAAAEESSSTFQDGPCAGSVVGILALDGKVLMKKALSPKIKAEGVWAEKRAGRVELLIVTDQDDSGSTATLYGCSLGRLPKT